MPDNHLVSAIIGAGLILVMAGVALVLQLRHASRLVDELLPPGTVDLADPRPVPVRPDPTDTLWKGAPGPYADYSRVWVRAERPGVLGHELANPMYTVCGARTVDDLGRPAGQLMLAGVAYERLRANWCAKCYPATAPVGGAR